MGDTPTRYLPGRSWLRSWYAIYMLSFFATAAVAAFAGPWWALLPACWVGYCIGRHEVQQFRAWRLDEANARALRGDQDG